MLLLSNLFVINLFIIAVLPTFEFPIKVNFKGYVVIFNSTSDKDLFLSPGSCPYDKFWS